ncbi:MAG: universal stress protein [Rhodospirillaceae bacterium]|nr:universal stress protein [Rhodospirillaceae bacterium]MBT4463432.1 universal stress protein [Rhodospirillaceae bacterium]MBT5014344.1 universal stress protein [Rhodospirillaceae bacterium]MBT5307898.1 universal stress protein [Rhodospirillaceae bacterium]MBT7355264.1 universal stress protein [Rhodospirillaceae bacterium]
MSDQDNTTESRTPLSREDRFRILVCIDGSDESYQCLRYAAKLGGGVDADIVLVYVRPADQGLRSGGLQVNVARENMLNWGLELPGIKYLKKGRDILIEMGIMGTDWEVKTTHTGVEGDPLGDNKIEYINEDGKEIVLKMKVASDVASGILQQWELGPYDIIIMGASGRGRGLAKSLWDPAVAEKVALNAPCSVLLARGLDVGHGHLICIDGSQRSMDTVRKDAYLASRCECPVSLLSIAQDVESEPEAQKNIDAAVAELTAMDITIANAETRVGNPVEEIVEAGPDYSVVVVSESNRTGLQRIFMKSVAFQVLRQSYVSVMVVR